MGASRGSKSDNLGGYGARGNATERFVEWITPAVGLDCRSLACFRVALSILLLLDLWVRSIFLHDHYTLYGVLPPAQAVETGYYSFSFHYVNPTYSYQVFMFCVAATFAFFMLIGYRTKLFTVLSWLMLVSLHNRNPLVLNGGDDFLRVTLFWSMFLPTAACYSIDCIVSTPSRSDHRFDDVEASSSHDDDDDDDDGDDDTHPDTEDHDGKHRRTTKSPYVVCVGGVAMLLQFSLIYWFTVALKTGVEWRQDYSATWYALHLDQFTTRTGRFVLQYLSAVLPFLTWAVFYWEKYGPFCFFVPGYLNGPMRTLGVLGFWALHIGFGMCLELGFFMYVPGVASLAFLPAWFWDSVVFPFINRRHERLSTQVLYDGRVAPLEKGLHVLRMFFLVHQVALVPCRLDDQEDAATSLHDSVSPLLGSHHIAVRDKTTNQVWYDYAGVQVLVRQSPLLWPLAPLLSLGLVRSLLAPLGKTCFTMQESSGVVPQLLRQGAESVAQRVVIHRTEPRSLRRRRILVEIFALFILLYVINWNFASLYRYPVPDSVRWIGPALRVDQWWGMFSPYPPKDDGWTVIPAVLEDGSEIDLFNGGKPVTFEKPELVSRQFPIQRWRKYIMNLQAGIHQPMRLHYGRYLCRQWNWFGPGQEKGKRVQSFKMIFMLEHTPAPGEVAAPASKVELWSHVC